MYSGRNHEIVAQTDTGLVRSHNEDSLAVSLQDRLVVIADGMGGYQAGEIASRMAADIIVAETIARIPKHDPANAEGMMVEILCSAINIANRAVWESARACPSHAGMGTTVVAGFFAPDRLTVAHLGDSRLYQLRDLQLRRITRDHSLLQEQIDSGLISEQEAQSSPNKNFVTRALGIDPEVHPEVAQYPIEEGDLYLFCTDGLTDMVSEPDIALAMSALGNNLRVCAQHLIANANDNGGRDNVSIVLVRVNRKSFAMPAQA
jgi:serine/threonine protein phosphatase PrpC